MHNVAFKARRGDDVARGKRDERGNARGEYNIRARRDQQQQEQVFNAASRAQWRAAILLYILYILSAY